MHRESALSIGGNIMRHSEIILKHLKTIDECMIAIDCIEFDHRNIIGGRAAWISGYETYLTVAAQKKIDSINKRIAAFDFRDDC